MACSTRSRPLALTCRVSLTTCETVVTETPARSATSLMVAMACSPFIAASGQAAIGPALAQGVDDHRNHDHRAGDDALARLARTHLCEPGFEHRDDQHAEEGVDHRAASAHEAGAADHHGRDHLQLDADAGIR